MAVAKADGGVDWTNTKVQNSKTTIDAVAAKKVVDNADPVGPAADITDPNITKTWYVVEVDGTETAI